MAKGKKKGTLTAENLKQTLWETLLAVRAKKIEPAVAASVATNAREIMRVVRTEIDIAKLSGAKLKNLLPSGTE